MSNPAAALPDGVVAAPATGADDQMARCAARALHESAYLPLRQVQCRCGQGILMLYGRVPTYHLKQIAQVLVRRLPHVDAVANCIVVE